MLLPTLQVLDPTCMYLSRGNHESHSMNKMYGFDGEVRKGGGHRGGISSCTAVTARWVGGHQ